MRRFRSLAAAVSLSLLALPAVSHGAAKKGTPAPPFNVTTSSGQRVSLANYRGHVLLLDFFATWCAPCREAVPNLAALNRKLGKQGLQVLGLAINDGEKELKEFAAEMKLNYPVALGSEDLASDYGVSSIPTLVLIDRKGAVVEKFRGFSGASDAKLEEQIRKLLAE
jgi:thiol-disulfide isomerase/thioredoxin